jgi:hypothetical protein
MPAAALVVALADEARSVLAATAGRFGNAG